jgi:hypothetical protein
MLSILSFSGLNLWVHNPKGLKPIEFFSITSISNVALLPLFNWNVSNLKSIGNTACIAIWTWSSKDKGGVLREAQQCELHYLREWGCSIGKDIEDL